MAWTNRAVGVTYHLASATSAIPTITSTTAGDLVVFTGQFTTGTDPGGFAFTPPAGGWIPVIRVYDGAQEQTEIWYLPNCTAGQTSYTFTCATGTVNAQLSTFFGGNQAVTDKGSNTAGSGTGVTVSLSGTANPGDLVVAVFGCRNASAVSVTWTTPTNYTVIDAYSASAAFHSAAYYRLSGAGGAESVAGLDSVTMTNWSGVAVSFGGSFPSAPTGLPPAGFSPLSGVFGPGTPFQAPQIRTPPSPAPVPFTITNNFEEGTTGVTPTSGLTGNTVGPGQTPFDFCAIGGAGNTMTFDNTHVAHGYQALEINNNAANGFTCVGWTVAGVGGGQPGGLPQPEPGPLWFRAYFYFPVLPSTFITLIEWTDSVGGTLVANLSINPTNGLMFFADGNNNGVGPGFSNSIPLGQWFRVEGYVIGDAGSGVISCQLFADTDGTNPLETQTVTNVNTRGPIGEVRFGLSFFGFQTGPFWMDDLGVSNVGPLGPVGFDGASYQPLQLPGVGGAQFAPLAGVFGPGAPFSLPAAGCTYPPPDWYLTNTSEGGVNGTTVSVANSGGASGNAWDVAGPGPGATVAFDNTQAAHGSLAVKFQTTATSAGANVWWSEASIGGQVPTDGKKTWFRVYVFFSSFVNGGGWELIEFVGAGEAAGIWMAGNTGILYFADQALGWTGGGNQFPQPLPLNQWVRLEGFVQTGRNNTGSCQMTAYLGDSNVPIMDTGVLTGQNLQQQLDQVRFGVCFFGAANVSPFWMDDFALSTYGPIGPAGYRNDFEEGSTDVNIQQTVTAANSGPCAPSSPAVETPLTNLATANATVVYDNSAPQVAAHGTVACKIATGGVAAQSYVGWNLSPALTQFWFRENIYIPSAVLGTSFRPVEFTNGGSEVACVFFQTTGILEFLESTLTARAVLHIPCPLNQWFRIEGYVLCSATVGVLGLSMYSSLDAINPTDSVTSLAVCNTSTQADASRFGRGSTAASNFGPIWIDDIAISPLGPLGPVNPSGQPLYIPLAQRSGWQDQPSRRPPRIPARGSSVTPMIVKPTISQTLGARTSLWTPRLRDGNQDLPMRGSAASWNQGISQPIPVTQPAPPVRQQRRRLVPPRSVSQPLPVHPVAFPPDTGIRDVRRMPKIPLRSNIASWFQGVSQPPIPPAAVPPVRQLRRKLFPSRAVAAAPVHQTPEPGVPPQAIRNVRRDPKIPPRGSTASWDKGISQPPIPPVAVHASRRPFRMPVRGSLGQWARGIPQPPIPPTAQGRPQRRPLWLPVPRGSHWTAVPPVPPAPLNPQEQPGRRARPTFLPKWARVATPILPHVPPTMVPGSEHAQRLPVHLFRSSRGWTQGISQPPINQPPAPPVRQQRRRIWPPRGIVAAPVHQTPEPGIPPEAPRPVRRPPYPRRSSMAQWFKGISQPPIPPTGVRPIRKPPYPRRSSIAQWNLGASQPPIIPEAISRPARRIRLLRGSSQTPVPQMPPPPPKGISRPVRRIRLLRGSTPQLPVAPPPTPPLPPRRRLLLNRPLQPQRLHPGEQPHVFPKPAPPAPREPSRWWLLRKIPWWRKRGIVAPKPAPPGIPFLPSGQVVYRVHSAHSMWTAVSADAQWKAVALDARWSAMAVDPRSETSAVPAMWRIVMQDFDPIAAVSLENIPVTWVARLAGVEIDPSPTGLNLPVQFAFPVSSGNELQPAEPGTWLNGGWFAGTTSVGHVAIILVGPGGQTVLTAGVTYDVWSRIVGSPEQPAKFCGQLRVY